MPLLLNVPYDEKDKAKALGAKWCPELKKWYAPERKNYSKFAKWLDGSIVICDQIYIVEGTRTCYACQKQTTVIGFGFDKFFDIFGTCLDLSEGDICIGTIGSRLPTDLETELEERYGYKWSYSKSTKSYYYANRCCHCNAIQGNYFLFEEVDSPFFIDGKEAAEKLSLHRIRLHHDVCVIAGIRYGSEDYLIKKLAQIDESDMQWSAEMLPDHLLNQAATYQRREQCGAISTPATVQVTYASCSSPQNTVPLRTIPAAYIPTSVTPPKCSWWLMLFYTVFFGWLGLHRFYAEKMISGAIYLMTLGLFGVGWVIDIFAVLTTLFRDKQRRRIKI